MHSFCNYKPHSKRASFREYTVLVVLHLDC